MAKTDVSMKVWLKDKPRFADVFNGALFQGEQIIKPDELELMDSEADIVLTDKDDNTWFGRRNRDVIMKVIICQHFAKQTIYPVIKGSGILC